MTMGEVSKQYPSLPITRTLISRPVYTVIINYLAFEKN